MGTFIQDGAAVLPDVKTDARPASGATTEWASGDANKTRTALLDLRSQVVINTGTIAAEVAARSAADAAIIASGAEPANVGIAPVIATGSTAVRTVADRFADVVNVKDFASIQAAIDAAPDGGRVVFPSESFNVGTAITIRSRLILDLGGATLASTVGDYTIVVNDASGVRILGGKITLSGTSTKGITYTGTVSDLLIAGVEIVGSGVVADGHEGITNLSGQTLSGVRIIGNLISDVCVGISVNAGLSGSLSDCVIAGNRVLDSVGGTSGTGYGIHCATAQATFAGTLIADNYVEGCQRHGIYVAMGIGAIVRGNRVVDHRATLAAGDTHGIQRPAISIGRSRHVTVADNIIDSPQDGAMDVFCDAADPVVSNISITNNQVRNWKSFPALTIGTSSPSTDGYPEAIVVSGNQFTNDVAVTGVSGGASAWLRLYCGKSISILKNVVELWNATTNPEMTGLIGSDETAGTKTYSDLWRFADNIYRSSGSSPGYAYRVDNPAATSGIRMEFNGLMADGLGSTFYYPSGQASGTSRVVNHPSDGFDVSKMLVTRPMGVVSADRGDASQTLVAGVDAPIQRWATTLTQNRTVTLSTSGAANGDTFRIVRTGLGAFTLDVGGLKTIASGTAAFVDVAFNGSAWVLVGYGAL